jgi:hypothetical protein
MDLAELLQLPFRDRDWAIKMLLGTVITVVPVLNLAAGGYMAACLYNGLKDHWQMPEWNNWPELFKNGLFVFLIVLAYLLVPILLGFFLVMVPGVGVALLSIILLIVGMMIPMAIANFARYGELKDAFMVGEIFYYTSKIINQYIMAYLAAVLLVSLGMIILIALPFIGVIGGFIIYYCGLIFFFSIGILYRSAIAG